jgi:uncharacterized phiE125 gp8 family phage protein
MRIISQSAVEQISLVEARLHCRVDASGSPPTSPEDDELSLLILGVRKFTERYLGRSLTMASVQAAIDAFPSGDVIELEGGPVLGIDSIRYTDADGIEQVMDAADYSLNTDQVVARVILATDAEWPTTEAVPSAVRITYTLGYTAAGDSPNDQPMSEDIKVAMLLIIAFLHKNRGDEDFDLWMRSGQIPIPPAARLFLSPHILRKRFA